MRDCYFVRLDETAESGRYRGGGHTAGPWSSELQAGGPPNALAVAAAERRVAAETGRADLVPLRLAADFVGPVPVGELDVQTRVLRLARSAALVEVTVSGGGRDCLLVRVWFVRAADTVRVAGGLVAPADVPDRRGALGVEFGYGESLDWRFVHGRFDRPGPAAAWVRPTIDLVEGYELSGLARTVLIADSASGISAELDWGSWSFVNVDLDVHLVRPFTGDWLLMEAWTQVGPNGSALARSALSDVRGPIGAGLQTLVLAEMSS